MAIFSKMQSILFITTFIITAELFMASFCFLQIRCAVVNKSFTFFISTIQFNVKIFATNADVLKRAHFINVITDLLLG